MRFLALLLIAVIHVAVYVIFASLRPGSSLNWLGVILAVSAGVITYLLERSRRAALSAGSGADEISRGTLPGFYLPFASALLVKSLTELYSGLPSDEFSDVLWSGSLVAISLVMLAAGSWRRVGA